MNLFLGIVENGRFITLLPEKPSAELTTIQREEARSPESGRINLAPYEGGAVMVQGNDNGGWIYSASVIDHAGPILTAVVRKVFARKKRAK